MTTDKTIYYLEGLPLPETPQKGNPPPFWKKTDLIGKPLSRVDAYERVSGSAMYPSDIVLPNMLYGAILRCPHPQARVLSIDTTEAEKMTGVRGVLSGNSQEVQGIKWKFNKEQTPLFDPHCLFEGEVVAAVVAGSWYQAADAVRAMKVSYEVLPFVVNHEKASQNSSVKVRESGNVLSEKNYRRGDVRTGFAEALTLPLSKMRIIGHYMGSGFGSQLSKNQEG